MVPPLSLIVILDGFFKLSGKSLISDFEWVWLAGVNTVGLFKIFSQVKFSKTPVDTPFINLSVSSSV